MEKYIEAGKIINTHGVRGDVKLEHWCDSADVLAGFKSIYMRDGIGYTPYRVISSSVFKNFVLMKLEGIDSIEDAVKLKNRTVFAAREDIPVEEGSFLVCDLIGTPVIDIDTGIQCGVLTDVLDGAASQLYEIDTGSGKALVPAVSEFVKQICPGEGIYIKPIEGLLEP